MKRRVMFIVPYQGLANIISSIEIPKEFDITVKVGNLNEGVKLALEAEKQGYDLIISRGGTAVQIEEVVSVPVVHIEITGYDILRIFTMIADVDNKVALVGYPNISEGAATICSILEYDVNLITINSQTEVEEMLYRLQNENYSVVVGDVVTVTHAKKIGLQGVLLTSGKEAVFDSLKAGLRMFELLENNNNKYEVAHNLLESMPLPTAIFDKHKEIIYHNESFVRKIVKPGITTNSQFIELLNNLDENQEEFYMDEKSAIGFIIKTFVIKGSEKLRGIIIKSFQNNISNTFIQREITSENPNIIGHSNTVRTLKNHIDDYSKNKGIISIIGEKGTGKKTIAKAIHFKKFGLEHPLYLVDLMNVSQDMIVYINHYFKSVDRGSIVFENTENISPHYLKEILKHIDDELQLFILFNSIDTIENDVRISFNHLESINDLQIIHLPSLRNRPEDIQYFVNYYLSILNSEKGLEILGIKKEALEVLEQYNWNENITQLKLLIKEISSSVKNHYIELDDVEFLKKSLTTDAPDEITIKIDSLKNIEKQIIEEVLNREKGNQSKTSKILGINRSTLWRKLNE